MAYLVNDIYLDVQDYLSGRSVPQAACYGWIQRAVWELSEDYKFPNLQVTGPQVALTQFIAGPYSYNSFMQSADANLDITHIDSFFIYYEPPVPLSASNGENPGLQLEFRTIDSIESSLNIVGQTIYWTRYNGAIYVAFAPSIAYIVYARYRKEHPFSTPIVGTDPILLGDSWRDIVGYATAQRAAVSLDMMDRSTNFHNMLYGDPKFQATGGTEGQPGLIFRRVSQEERDKQLSNIRFRLMVPNPMR